MLCALTKLYPFTVMPKSSLKEEGKNTEKQRQTGTAKEKKNKEKASLSLRLKIPLHSHKVHISWEGGSRSHSLWLGSNFPLITLCTFSDATFPLSLRKREQTSAPSILVDRSWETPSLRPVISIPLAFLPLTSALPPFRRRLRDMV